jgi:rare lipoprotein A
VGMASWYGTVYDHRKAANGEVYEQNGLTAASRTLPLGSMARVTNLTTGQVAMLRITDRGPFVPGRIIDLSLGAAKALGVYRMGVAKVKVEGFATAEIAALPARWCVQIGAFASEGDALQVKNELAKRFGTAKVIEFKGPTGSWVRVTAEVPDQARTEEIAARVKVPNAAVVAYVTRTN